MNSSGLLRRSEVRMLPDTTRVVTRPFLPGQEAHTHGISRAESVVDRIMALSEAEVAVALSSVLASFAGRHSDLEQTFREHFALVAHRVPTWPDLTRDRITLIGAYLTHEYSIEGAALFNPAIVAHPDQSGCHDGELRFLMSVRAVGEGHISSVEFRTGIVGPDDVITLDVPGGDLSTGVVTPGLMSVAFLREALDLHGDAFNAESLLQHLPEMFLPSELEEVLASTALDSPLGSGSDGLLERIRRTAASTYRLRFSAGYQLSERVIMPTSAAESHGLEDVRLVEFRQADGTLTYLGTYTAYDGSHIAPHMMRTDDFLTFDFGPMMGPAAHNKGMALFPRRIGGLMWTLSRWDRENISIASSIDGIRWESPAVLVTPRRAWDLVQVGACSSPIEMPEGWLVFTHGVGPMRVYSIGAVLLDLDDPTRVIGVLDAPLLSPQSDERDGYVPNVLYSCGALIHGDSVVLPYGCSDATIRFAFIDLAELLSQFHPPRGSE